MKIAISLEKVITITKSYSETFEDLKTFENYLNDNDISIGVENEELLDHLDYNPLWQEQTDSEFYVAFHIRDNNNRIIMKCYSIYELMQQANIINNFEKYEEKEKQLDVAGQKKLFN